MKTIAIKHWLLDMGLTQAALARKARVSRALVNMTITGHRHSKVVVRLLRRLGCPEESLQREEKEKAA
jgi:transcriptional regulator with XRE-family HTH domain